MAAAAAAAAVAVAVANSSRSSTTFCGGSTLVELTQPSYELCIHITYILWYGSTECLAYAAVAAAECAARAAWHSSAYTTCIARRIVAAAASRQKPLHCPQRTARTTAVEEASIYCTNWPTFAKNQ